MPSWAIRFAAGCENVFMVLSGMSNMAQLSDNMSYMKEFQPLTVAQQALLPRVVQIINDDIAVDCTACRYCVEDCPQKIDIPKCIALYNQAKHTENADPETQRKQYAELTEETGKASSCVKCKKCEQTCPQHIPITAALRKIAEAFE